MVGNSGVSCSAETFRNALDHVTEAVVISDDGGIVQFVNRRVCTLFGYPHDELVGHTVERLVPGRLRRGNVTKRIRFSAERVRRRRGSGLMLTGVRKDGTEVPVELNLGAVQDGARALFVAAIRDVTPPLGRCNDLPHWCEGMTRKDQGQEAAQASLAQARRASASLLLSMSHALRQPLQSILMLCAALVARGQWDEAMLTHINWLQTDAMSRVHTLHGPPTAGDIVGLHPLDGTERDRCVPEVPVVSTLRSPVLIVLENPSVREATHRFLEANDYFVLAATTAQEAHQIARLRPDIGVVITEQTLGHSAGGAELIMALQSYLDPGLRAVLLCDDPVGVSRHRIRTPGSVRLARIPVHAEQLLCLLSE